MPARPCLEPGCPQLTRTGSRCPQHQRASNRARDARRGNTAQRGYGSAWQALSRAVLERDHWVCRYCGAAAKTADHVVPKAHGGTDDMSNLVACCVSCNSVKGDRFLTGPRP